MKTIDFSKPGLIPRYQELEAFLQSAWQEIITPLVQLGVLNGAPAVLSGMVSTLSGGTTTVSAGWFVYNGQAVRFPAQTYATAVTAGDAVYVVITPTSVPTVVPYNNGSTPNVINDVTGVLTVLPNTTPIDATHFLLSAIVAWGAGLIQNNIGVLNAIRYVLSGTFIGDLNITCTNYISLYTTAWAENITINLERGVPGQKWTCYFIGYAEGTTVIVATPLGTSILIGAASGGSFAADPAGGIFEVTYLGNDGTSDIYFTAVTNA
jgi:hypothetical protein